LFWRDAKTNTRDACATPESEFGVRHPIDPATSARWTFLT
jgi:hypothetical protein